MLKRGDKIGIVACSNALSPKDKNRIEELADAFANLGLTAILSQYIFAENSVFSGTGAERAGAFNDFYRDEGIKAVFDISGGDIANELLNYIDYETVKQHPKPFFGYSDLTTIDNAIYAKTGYPSYLYQARFLVGKSKETQISNFKKSMLYGQDNLFQIDWHFLRGTEMSGVVVGGNIRCFLKLAGTPYMPDLDGKILFLESYGGGVAQMKTYLAQLSHLGAFDKISGLLLGTFTQMEECHEPPDIAELALNTVDVNIPIAQTRDVGHGNNSKCLVIGKKYTFAVRTI